MKNKLITAAIILLVLWACASALAVTSEHSTTNGLLTVSNATSTAEWKPQAAFIVFPSPTSGVINITRTANGVTVPLAGTTFSNTAGVTWLPTTDYPIRPGNTLAVSSSVHALTLQLERSNFP